MVRLTRPRHDECCRGAVRGHELEHQIEVWCSLSLALLCSVNDAVNALPCSTWSYLNGRLS
jgi:hypothetical protein